MIATLGLRHMPIVTLILLIIITSCINQPGYREQVKLEPKNQLEKNEVINMKLTSPAFENNSKIPSKYTCDAEDINPELLISDIPKNTKSLVLIMDDPDAPVGIWVHWIVLNIDPTYTVINEDSVPGIQGKNSWGRNDYGGPCPPSGTHRYFFKLYALDTILNLRSNVTKSDVENSMKGHILSSAELIGLYSRR